MHPSSSEAHKKKGAEEVPRLALAARGTVLEKDTARLANVQHFSVAVSEQVWLLKFGSVLLHSWGATGITQDQQTWPLVAGIRV